MLYYYVQLNCFTSGLWDADDRLRFRVGAKKILPPEGPTNQCFEENGHGYNDDKTNIQ